MVVRFPDTALLFMIAADLVLIALTILCVVMITRRVKKMAALDAEIADKQHLLHDICELYNKKENDLALVSMKVDQLTRDQDQYSKNYQALTEFYTELNARQQQEQKEKIEQLKREFDEVNTQLLHDQNEILLEAQADFVSNLEVEVAQLLEKKLRTLADLSDLQAKVGAAVEVSKRNMEEETQQNFYRLQLSTEDIADIKKLREIEPFLRHPDVLNKLIYKCYYENAYTALVGRIFEKKRPYCGIYKITNIQNHMAYVGQSVDIAERWRQHIKRGVGAEAVTRNKLYPAMKELGPENFTFELIEECPAKELDAKEDFWQDFYKVKEFGYSIK